MKLLLVFALLALICMVRSAPKPIGKQRQLILPDYHAADEEVIPDDVKIHDDETPIDADEEEDEEEETTTTTTTTTTRRSFNIPTRNRNLIPSRKPIQTQRSTSPRTTTTTSTAAFDDDEQYGDTTTSNEYDGDFKYIKDLRQYAQKLMDDIRKLIRNITGYEFNTKPQRQQNNQYGEDE